MSKKVILSSLLASAAILGAAGSADAAAKNIGELKDENKMITVTYDKARLYTNSKLEKSSIAKKGKVYKVDGYRNIDGKHFYRVYQTDANGEETYKGYLIDRDTKDLKAEKTEGSFKGKEDMNVWKNLYFSQKRETLSKEKAYFAKYKYTLGNGRSYYSLYYKNSDNKDTWAGYMNVVDTEPLQATSYKKYMTLHRDTQSWKNLYFTIKGKEYLSPKYTNNFYAKRYYKLNNYTYYSMYRTDAEGNESWCGYVNGNAVNELKPTEVKENQAVQVVSNAKTYKDHFFNQKGEVKDGQNIIVKRYYTYGSGKSYASIYTTPDKDGNSTWLGYVNVNAIQSTAKLNEAVTAAKEAIEQAENILKTAQASDASKEAAQKVIDAAKALVEKNDVEQTADIEKIPAQIKKAMEQLKPAATSADLTALGTAIKDGKEVMANVEGMHLTNTDAVKTALETAEKVYAEVKDNKANNEEVEKATNALNEALKSVGVNTQPLKDAIEALKETESNVYLTKNQEDSLKRYITDALDDIKSDKVEDAKEMKEALDLITKAISDMNENQPNKEECTKLNNLVKEAEKLESFAKNQGDKLFAGYDAFKDAATRAENSIKEIAKDNPNGENTATVGRSKEQVNTLINNLEKALADLTINPSTTQKYDDAAKKAIESLEGENKEQAENQLANFEAVAKTDGALDSKNSYQTIINSAEKLNQIIHDSQKEELKAAVDKATEVMGASDENAKFYTNGTFETLKEDDQKAEQRLTKFDDKFGMPSEYVVNGNAAATIENKVEADIKALDVKDWDEKEVDGQVQLTKYTGNYTASTSSTQKNSQVVIEVPGSLKGEQVVLAPISDQQLFPEQTSTGNGQVEIKFEENNGRKVKAISDLTKAMANNKQLGKIDFTGFDSTGIQSFEKLLMNDYYLQDVQGYEELVKDSTKDLEAMFANTNIQTLDVTKWDTSNVTNMNRLFTRSKISTLTGIEKLDVSSVTDFNNMFGGMQKLTTLDLSDWNMEKATKENTQNMFLTKDGNSGSWLTSIKLPNEFHGVSGQGPKLVVEALQEAGKKSRLNSDVEVKDSTDKKLGTVEKNGTWKSEEEKTQITNDQSILNNGAKLSRAVLTSEKASEPAKELAEVVEAAYEVDKYSVGDKEKSIAGLENNRAWTEFGGQGNGSYYDAMKDLQDYARNTTSVEDGKLTSDRVELIDDMKGLRVTLTELQEALDAVKGLQQNVFLQEELKESAVEQAEKIIEDKDTGIENWKKINDLIKELKQQVTAKK